MPPSPQHKSTSLKKAMTMTQIANPATKVYRNFEFFILEDEKTFFCRPLRKPVQTGKRFENENRNDRGLHTFRGNKHRIETKNSIF